MTRPSARTALALLAAAAFVAPLAMMLWVSVQPPGSGLARGETGGELAFENYAHALERMGDFRTLVARTSLITAICVVGQCLTCSLAGYALARVPFRGRGFVFALVIAAMLVPDQVAAIPRFLLFRWLGMVDTILPLVLPAVLGGAPLFVFLFRQYFLTLGEDLVEAARLDGCGHLAIWWRVMLPLAKPMLATVAIFTFLATWNDFWAPLVYLVSPENRTLTLALAGFQRTYDTAVEWLMAASAVVAAPCILVYFLAQRLFLRGVQVAASKR